MNDLATPTNLTINPLTLKHLQLLPMPKKYSKGIIAVGYVLSVCLKRVYQLLASRISVDNGHEAVWVQKVTWLENGWPWVELAECLSRF